KSPNSRFNSCLPLVIFALGVVFGRRAKALENLVWRSQKAIEWRQALFDRVVGELNKPYCSFMYVGGWDQRTPPQILDIKRTLDRELINYRRLLADMTMKSYDELMKRCFKIETGRGSRAQIRANVSMYKDLDTWRSSYEDMFVPETERTTRDTF